MTSIGLRIFALFFSVVCITPLHAQTTVAPNDAKQIVLLPPSGTDSADRQIAEWQQRLAEKPAYSPYWERLGWSYIAKARLTQDSGYYKLAELTVIAWQNACGPNLDAKLLQGHVDHNLHRFKAAEAIARDLIAHRKAPSDYALLSDALMEQGKIDEAVVACQTLCDLRPGVEAFTRIAHLRLLSGDLNGAIEAMAAAIRAGDPHDDEGRAWMYTRLALYQLLKGEPRVALAFAEKALAGAPRHPLALAMKGRALHAVGDDVGAIAAFQEAADLNPVPDNLWWLADLLRNAGRTDDAAKVEKRIEYQGPAVDPRTTALFLDTRGDALSEAVQLAADELNNREDVFTHDAVAFAYFKTGNTQRAAAESTLAMSRHTCDPRIVFHAGLIAEARGDRAEAARCYAQAKLMEATLTPSEAALLRQHLHGSLAANP